MPAPARLGRFRTTLEIRTAQSQRSTRVSSSGTCPRLVAVRFAVESPRSAPAHSAVPRRWQPVRVGPRARTAPCADARRPPRRRRLRRRSSRSTGCAAGHGAVRATRRRMPRDRHRRAVPRLTATVDAAVPSMASAMSPAISAVLPVSREAGRATPPEVARGLEGRVAAQVDDRSAASSLTRETPTSVASSGPEEVFDGGSLVERGRVTMSRGAAIAETAPRFVKRTAPRSRRCRIATGFPRSDRTPWIATCLPRPERPGIIERIVTGDRPAPARSRRRRRTSRAASRVVRVDDARLRRRCRRVSAMSSAARRPGCRRGRALRTARGTAAATLDDDLLLRRERAAGAVGHRAEPPGDRLEVVLVAGRPAQRGRARR